MGLQDIIPNQWAGNAGPFIEFAFLEQFRSLKNILEGPPEPPDLAEIMQMEITPAAAAGGNVKRKGAIDWIYAGRNPRHGVQTLEKVGMVGAGMLALFQKGVKPIMGGAVGTGATGQTRLGGPR